MRAGIPTAILSLLAVSSASGLETVKVARFTKAPIPACRTVLVRAESPDLTGFHGPVPSSITDDLRLVGTDVQQQLAKALQGAGFDAKTEPASCQPCDLTISFRVTEGQVKVRTIKVKGLGGLGYYAPENLALDFQYVHGSLGLLGRVRAKLTSTDKERVKLLVDEIAEFTAARVARKGGNP